MDKYAIAVIGSGGLSAAQGAAKAGKKVILIDPLPFEAKGFESLKGVARFKGPHLLEVTDPDGKRHLVKGKKIVIATSSSPEVPHIPGLEKTPYFTSETLPQTTPKSIAILGGGPIGCALAQLFARRGSTVHLIHRHPNLLPKEEPKAQATVAEVLKKEGVTLHLNATIGTISHFDGPLHLTLEKVENGKSTPLEAEALLIAVGRTPNIKSLALMAAHVNHTERGIPTDRFGRTNKKHIFVLSAKREVAEQQAHSIIHSLIYPWPFLKALSKQAVPRITFTDPEVASVGLSVKEAQQLYGSKRIAVHTVPFSAIDRARLDGREEGHLTIVTTKWRGKILGATIVGPRAGEMLAQFSTAIACNIPLKRLTDIIYPYPTYSQAVQKAAFKNQSEG